jgi:hypothetical protein
MSNLAKILCLAAFLVLLIIWTLLVMSGKAEAGPLVNFLQTSAMAVGAAILALINPQGTPTSLSAPLVARTGQLLDSDTRTLEQPSSQPASQATPGFEKPGTGGFVTLRMLGSILGSVLLAACLLVGLMAMPGCTSWNSGVSAVNTYTSAQITAQQSNVQGVNDNAAALLAASICATPYGELVRNGSGNTNFPAAVIKICGAPSGMAVLETSNSGVSTVLSAGGYVRKTDLSAKLQALIAAELGTTAISVTTNATAAQ